MTADAGAGDDIRSARHPLAIRIIKLCSRPQLARREGVFLLAGAHLLEEAVRSPHEAEVVLIAPPFSKTRAGEELARAAGDRGWPIRRLSETLMRRLAPTQTPQGILGLFRRPAGGHEPALPDMPGPLTLCLAGVQDPVNMGALARTAYALGCGTLITTAKTVDPYHLRALRASSGALLHLRVAAAVSDTALEDWATRHRARLVALVARGGRVPDRAAIGEDPLILLLGAEGQGLPASIDRLCTERWTVPIREHVDSLGVAAAGAIALYCATVARGGSPDQRGSPG